MDNLPQLLGGNATAVQCRSRLAPSPSRPRHCQRSLIFNIHPQTRSHPFTRCFLATTTHTPRRHLVPSLSTRTTLLTTTQRPPFPNRPLHIYTSIHPLPSTGESYSPRWACLIDHRSNRARARMYPHDTRTSADPRPLCLDLHYIVLPFTHNVTLLPSSRPISNTPRRLFITTFAGRLLPPHHFSLDRRFCSSSISPHLLVDSAPLVTHLQTPLEHLHDGRYRRVRLPFQGEDRLRPPWSGRLCAVTRRLLAPSSLLTPPWLDMERP